MHRMLCLSWIWRAELFCAVAASRQGRERAMDGLVPLRTRTVSRGMWRRRRRRYGMALRTQFRTGLPQGRHSWRPPCRLVSTYVQYSEQARPSPKERGMPRPRRPCGIASGHGGVDTAATGRHCGRFRIDLPQGPHPALTGHLPQRATLSTLNKGITNHRYTSSGGNGG